MMIREALLFSAMDARAVQARYADVGERLLRGVCFLRAKRAVEQWFVIEFCFQ